MAAAAQWTPVNETAAGWTPVQESAPAAPLEDNRSLLDHLANDPNSIPLDSYVHATERGFANIGQGTAQAIQGTAALLNPKPQDKFEQTLLASSPAALPVYRLFRGLGHTAEDAVKLAKAYHESGGPTLAEIGDVAGIGAGNLIPGIAASPEGLAAARGVASDVNAAGKTALASETAQKVSKSAKVVGASAEELPVVGSTVRAVKTLGKLRDIWGNPLDATKQNVPFAGETEPPISAKPAPAATPAGAKPTVTPAAVEKQINDALGGKPLQPNVALKNQVPASAQKLPDDFTPVEKSSVLKGYKYDPATQELEAITNSGGRYRTGEVTPEQFQQFEASDSKGAAWNQLRGNATPMGKYVGDKFVPYQRAGLRSASPDVASEPAAASEKPKSVSDLNAPPAPANEDLTSLLQKSVEQAKAKKLSDLANPEVETSYSPAQLAKRWGVDEDALYSGREQTRGMSAEQTEEYIQKLSERYKQGEKVDPVIETRDADNNIVSVDGRARAIAAQRAGVKRIPIIVRRQPATAAAGK